MCRQVSFKVDEARTVCPYLSLTSSFRYCYCNSVFGYFGHEVEKDEACRRVLHRRMKDGALAPCSVETDVTTTSFRSVEADGVVGGFPCQAR